MAIVRINVLNHVRNVQIPKGAYTLYILQDLCAVYFSFNEVHWTSMRTLETYTFMRPATFKYSLAELPVEELKNQDYTFIIKNEENVKNSYYCNDISVSQPIEYMQGYLSPEEFQGFLRGNAIKYLSRAGRKPDNSSLKDYKKALVYIGWLVDTLEGRKVKPIE